jgi:DNA-binding Lrp family transcriptional regulator
MNNMSKDSDTLRVDELDQRLLGLLQRDARQPVTSLAHALGISRGSVYARIERMERTGVIAGYTVKLGTLFDRRFIRAHIMIKVLPKSSRAVERQILALSSLTVLHSISGEYDLIATIEADDVTALNGIIDKIGDLQGVANTNSSIILESKTPR